MLEVKIRIPKIQMVMEFSGVFHATNYFYAISNLNWSLLPLVFTDKYPFYWMIFEILMLFLNDSLSLK